MLPHALLTPAFEAPSHRRGCATLAREILPPTARDEQIQDALNGATIVGSWPAFWCRRWEQQADESPLHVREMNSAHAIRLFQPASVLEPPLASCEHVLSQPGQQCVLLFR